uniref:Uncharacterized protein n=1 Tax=Arundo donax TaxID=35708 RepID=A0A0A8XUQ2_ARUDO
MPMLLAAARRSRRREDGWGGVEAWSIAGLGKSGAASTRASDPASERAGGGLRGTSIYSPTPHPSSCVAPHEHVNDPSPPPWAPTVAVTNAAAIRRGE